ncbi:zinc finger protein [Apiospora arundinis]|uniref:Zinc finger protein n=1 Tax=Apiospora arundinis TaxID=335852 RepID=A0ABR2HPN2_9PEZI
MVVSTLCPNTNVVAFIWGPLKFLLQTTSVSSEAFHELLDAYASIGEALPLLSQYGDLFHTKKHMVRVLALMYEDVLTFQRIILSYFQQPLWKTVFIESWKTCKSRFPGIFRNIAKRRSLIESQASPSQIEEARKDIQRSRRIEELEFDEQTLRRIRDVLNWLRPTNVDVDQADLVETRAGYPRTGHWLLENKLFKEWFDPRFPTIPPLLWLTGIPGAGKTMLASLVVQKARELNPAPAVLYFYCKHDNPERNNFVALGRSLLAQLLNHDNGLLPTFYQETCRSVEPILSSPKSIKDLLTLAFGNCKSAYIVLDGLDECPRQERQIITRWFRELVENLPNDKPERLRCLFISQDDGPARKDFGGLDHRIKIKAEDSQNDIEEYCRIEADKLHENHPSLPKDKVNWIKETVASSVGGLFLLARLIWTNLSCHTSIARLEEELEPSVFPKQINDAYGRIMIRINEQALQVVKEDAFRLLGWLVCAKRPLKWHEIQGMNSINLDEQLVDFERQSFIKSPKDLLASLVEMREDGSLEFVHLTAKLFLLDEGYVIPSREEISLANLCIDYLNLPAFILPPTPEGVLNGNYGFMDYAVLFWLPHLEIGTTLKTDEEDGLMGQLAESLGIFIEQHWNSPSSALSLAKRHSDKLQHFRTQAFYGRLEKAVASTRRQLKHFGDMDEREIALNIARVVRDVREVLENIASDELEPANQLILKERYGNNLFKCPRFSCQFFTIGFSSAAERNDHISKHERPFRCSDESCVSHAFGFTSESLREKHMREYHLESKARDEEFPTEEEVECSLMNDQTAAGNSQSPEDPRGRDETAGDSANATAATEQPASEAESEPQHQYRRRQKRPRQTEFKCKHCDTVFQKQYNLTSHLRTHNPNRDHVCSVCQKDFVRLADLRRHMSKHSGVRNFVCRGVLRNGQPWGCGSAFARAETLRKHHESRVGRSCIQARQQELAEELQ